MKQKQSSTPVLRPHRGQPISLMALLSALVMALTPAAHAASGVWTNRTASSWSVATNWTGGIVADGADNLANFSTLGSGIASLSVTLDSPRTLGNLKFGGATNLYLVGGSTLTLQNSTNLPDVNVASQTARVGVPLASSQPVLFDGNLLAITNDNNALSGGVVLQCGQFGFTSQGAIGSGIIQVGNGPGGNVAGAGQTGFNAISAAAAGTAPVTLTNDFVVRTIRWIVGQNGVGLNAQPVIINGNVALDMGTNNVRDLALQQNLTINGVLSGGQSGASQFGLSFGALAAGALTLANSGNTFVGNITFNSANTLGVNSDGALGFYNNRLVFTTAGTLRADASFTIPNTRGLGGIGFTFTANGTINCQTNDVQIDTIIQGAGGLIKNGTGKLTLTGQNTFTGGLTLNAGTLVVAGSGALASAAAVTIPTNCTFALSDYASAPNLSSVTINKGGLLKLSEGPTLNSIAPIVDNGVLDVSGLYSPFALNAGQTFSGSGVVTGSVVASSGASLVLGTVGTAATLSFSNDLTLYGQTLQFDLRNNTTEGSVTNDELYVAGNLTISGTELIYLNYLDGALASGTYKLIRYNSKSGGDFALGAAYPNVALDQTSNPNYVLLVVSGPAIANNLFWKGDGVANVWDISTTANWVTNFANPALAYTDPSRVTFDDNGSNTPAINLTSIVLPNTVTFTNNTKTYLLTGTGKISGTASLLKTGTNTAILDNATPNDFTGTMTISAGKLQIGNNDAQGTLGVGNVAGSGITTATLAYNRTDATMWGNTISSTLVQANAGSLTLGGSADNAGAGASVNNGGTLVLGKASSSGVHALGGATTVNTGGTLQLGGTGNDQIYSGVTVTLAGGTFDAAGKPEGFTALNGRGTITDSVGGGLLTLTAATGMNVSGGTMNANASMTFSGTGPGFLVQTGAVLNLLGGTDTYSVSTTASTLQGGGVFNMSGGSLSTSTYIAFGSGSGTAIANFRGGTFTQPGEFLQFYGGSSVVTVSGNATLNCHFFSYGDGGAGTNYFNGGLTRTDTFHQRNATAWAGYFNGGTIQAKSTQARFLPDGTAFSTANQHAYISTNGLIFDTQTYNIGISQNLEHDPSLGTGLDGGLTKLGTGILTLTGTNTFNGSISNLSGTLVFNNAGSYNNVVIGDNASNQVNMAAAGTSLTNNTLTLGTTGSGTQGLNFNLGTLGNPSVPIITVNGAVANNGNVVLALLAPTLSPGTIPLLRYGSMDAANFASTWSLNPFPYVTLTLTNDTVHKLVSVIVVPGVTAKWKGDVSTAWDTTTLNWRSNNVAVAYLEPAPPGEPVTFDDTAASFTVDISTATVNPVFINMTNNNRNNSYTLTGTLGIGGSGALFKNGAGALVLNNASGANTYSGITTVNGGSVIALAANLLSPNSAMAFNNSTLNIGNNNQTFNNLTLNNATVSGNGTLTGNGSALTVNNATNFSLEPVLAGNIALNVNGPGEMTLANSDTYTGVTTIYGGSVRVQNGTALGAGLFVGNTGTQIQTGGRVVLDGSFVIPEAINMNGTGPDGMGCVVVTNGNVLADGSPCQIVTPSTIYVSAGSSITFMGQINGNATTLYGAALTKSGPGTLQVGGTNGNSFTPASTVVVQGTLICSNTINSGTITVNSGAALQGSGTFQAGVYVAPGATLTPDINNYLGTLTSNSGLTNAGAMTLQILKTGSATNADRIVCSGTFVNTGTLTVITNVATMLPLAAGDTFKLFTLTNYSALSGLVPTLTSLPAGLGWTNQLTVDGTIAVVATVATNPTNITFGVVGSTLQLTWPLDHIGWVLEAQTNSLALGLGTNWVRLPSSATTNQVAVPMDPANGSVFYRLVYP